MSDKENVVIGEVSENTELRIGDPVILNESGQFVSANNLQITNLNSDSIERIKEIFSSSSSKEYSITNVNFYPDIHITDPNTKIIYKGKKLDLNKSAIEVFREELKNDPDYAWGWHCNIAMPIMDQFIDSHGVSAYMANIAGARLMKHLFDIDITQHSNWQDIIKWNPEEHEAYEKSEKEYFDKIFGEVIGE